MSFNAWLYAYADPINLTDPSGLIPCSMLPREDCGPDDNDPDLMALASLMFPTELDCEEPEHISLEYFALRFADLGSWPKAASIVKQYVQVGRLLGPSKLVSRAKIKDDWLLGVIIGGEFPDEPKPVFNEALEALSFLYHAAPVPGGYVHGCGARGCDTVRESIEFLWDVESFWSGVNSAETLVMNAQRLYAKAVLAQQGYSNGPPYSVIWGNYKPNSPLDCLMRAGGDNRCPNPVSPWWGPNETPYDQVDPDAHFVVFTSQQNKACGYGPGSCKGW